MASERIDPRDYPGEPISLDHYARYAFAGQFARGKRVLDVACGLGYGSRYLRAVGATSVLGVDLAEDAIRAARERYGTDGLTFLVADAHQLSDCVGGTWDLIASFETIEHLADPGQFISECRAVLAPGGVLLASVPNDANDPPGANVFHIQRFNRSSFDQLLRGAFAHIQIVPQYFALASCIDAGEHVQVGGLCTAAAAAQSASPMPGADEPDCFVAVCTNNPATRAERAVVVHARKIWERHQSLEQGNQWLEEQRANWERTATDLAADLERERAFHRESEHVKGWLEEQRANWERKATELAADLEHDRVYLRELEEAKRWLEEQRAKWERRATELSIDMGRGG